MARSSKKLTLFVEASPLVSDQVSGVPHALAGLLAALARQPYVQQHFDLTLIVPKSRIPLLQRWKGLETYKHKAVPLKFRIMNGLARRGLLPQMDRLLGSGVYLFGNFFNWSVTGRSQSLTYIHDICFALHPEYVQPANQAMLQKNVPRYIAQTDYIITVSQSVRREIIEHFGVAEERVVVLYNGFEASVYKPYPKAAVAHECLKHGLADKPYFVYIGNIEPRKNIEGLLRAFMKLPKKYGLVLIGSDGWLNESVLALIAKAQSKGYTVVRPVGYVTDVQVATLMSGAIALLQPSFYEGFGMPPLEALACGTPVVVADIGPLREVAGEAGIYCDPHDIGSIERAMQQAIDLSVTQKAKLITKAQAHIAQFSWDVSAQALLPALRTIVARQKARD